MKMKKYIVEAPVPKEGQNVSTGGIRENGKMASQFRNPVPYEEPTPAAIVRPYGIKELLIAELKEISINCALTLWQEIGAPAFKMVSQKLGQKVINALDSASSHTSKPSVESHSEESIINVDAIEIMTEMHDEKIIHFPSKHAG